MAEHSTRRPRDERFLPADGDNGPEGQAASDGETLAEKIRRYRQPRPDVSGEVAGPEHVEPRPPRKE